MSNEKLTQHVQDELYWDPKIDSAEIAVAADNGEVTLRGTVSSLYKKHEAKKAAERVFGVTSVDNQLEVHFLSTEQKRDDAELRGDVLQALMLNSLVPETVDANVSDGFVTLTGTADWQYQRDEADQVASRIVGALDIYDEITLNSHTNAHDVKESIESAFKRSAKLDGDHLDVSTSGGTVTIKGTVSSWAEHDEALDAAWSAPGVTSVDDRMTVAY